MIQLFSILVLFFTSIPSAFSFQSSSTCGCQLGSEEIVVTMEDKFRICYGIAECVTSTLPCHVEFGRDLPLMPDLYDIEFSLNVWKRPSPSEQTCYSK